MTRVETLRDALLVTVSGYTPALVEMFTDDVVVVSPALELRGRDELVEQLRRRTNVFSDVAVDLSATALEEDRLLGEWQLRAVHSGHLVLPDLTLPPTSRTLSLEGVAIARFLGSQIRELRQYWDAFRLLRALGVEASELPRTLTS